MSTIDTFFALVEIEHIAIVDPNNALQTIKLPTIKRVLRTYESRDRAEDDLALLQDAAHSPALYRLDDVIHVER